MGDCNFFQTMIFLIKYATRGRPDWFKKAIGNIQQTISAGRRYKILVSADSNDASMNTDAMRLWISHFNNIAVCYGESKNKVEAINADMDGAGAWDVLINMSDDMKFMVPDWDRIIERDLKSIWPDGDAFMHYNDGYAAEALATMTIIDRKYYERDNYIYHPSYRSFSCDAEAYYVAILRGRHHYFPQVLFLHQHPTSTPTPNDETYRVNSLHTKHDTDNYFERLNNNFGLQVDGPTPFDKFKREWN